MIPIPRFRHVVEVLVILGVIMWIVQDPHAAGGTVGGWIHGITHGLQQFTVFLRSL